MVLIGLLYMGEWYEAYITEEIDFRFPCGASHWDCGPLLPQLLFLFSVWIGFPIYTGGPELWVLWRHRHEPIAHGPRKYSWWRASVKNREQQPGILAAVGMVVGGFVLYAVDTTITSVKWYDDRLKTWEEDCNKGGCLANGWAVKVYLCLLVAAVPTSLMWGRPLPRFRRDLVAGYLLSVYSFLFVYVGGISVQMAYNTFGQGLGAMGVQIFFEMLVLLVFLWARKLASRAIPADPSAEAKCLIWVIFAGDAFAEMGEHCRGPTLSSVTLACICYAFPRWLSLDILQRLSTLSSAPPSSGFCYSWTFW
eukprot:COSAG05_NODE_314_length_11610_cov_17.223265_10_plen_308_part_00